jgi:hypothetical protein
MNGVTPLPARASFTGNRPPQLQPAPTPFQAPNALLSLVLFATALPSAGLMYLSYFPVSWGFLGWVALVPWLLLVRGRMGNFFRYFTANLPGPLLPAGVVPRPLHRPEDAAPVGCKRPRRLDGA